MANVTKVCRVCGDTLELDRSMFAAFTYECCGVPMKWKPRQIADSGNSINAHLAAQALGDGRGYC